MSKFKYECKFCESKNDLFSYYNGGVESEIVCRKCANERGYEKPPLVTKAMSGEIISQE